MIIETGQGDQPSAATCSSSRAQVSLRKTRIHPKVSLTKGHLVERYGHASGLYKAVIPR